MSANRSRSQGRVAEAVMNNTSLVVAVAFLILQVVLTLLYYNRKLEDYASERAEHLALISGAMCSTPPTHGDSTALASTLKAAGIESLRLYDQKGEELTTFVAGAPPPEGSALGLARALAGARNSRLLEHGGPRGDLLLLHIPIEGELAKRSGASAALGVFDYEALKDEALSSAASFALPTGGALLLVALALSVFLRNLREAQEKARVAAQETIFIKNRFLSTVSHELRTPLNGILGMLTLLKSTKLSPDQAEYAKMASRCGDSLLALVENILEHVKFEVGRTLVTSAPFSLRQELSEVTEPIAQASRVKGVEFAVEINDAVEDNLVGDAPKLRRIVENLLDNAVKFTASGRVTLKIRAAAVPGPGTTLVFRVEDTGIGIPADRLEHLFNPLTQGDPSATRAFGGLGIGLTLTRELVNALEGTIVVESKEGEGTIATVRIPFELLPSAPEKGATVISLEAALARSGGDLSGALTAFRSAQRSLASALAALSTCGEGKVGVDEVLRDLAALASRMEMVEVGDKVAIYRAALAGAGDPEEARTALTAALGRADGALKAILEG